MLEVAGDLRRAPAKFENPAGVRLIQVSLYTQLSTVLSIPPLHPSCQVVAKHVILLICHIFDYNQMPTVTDLLFFHTQFKNLTHYR